jgi:maltose alpha-D-glucosyltransferase/alpha-amylase
MQWTAGEKSGFSEADMIQWYSPVIAGRVYGPERVNVTSQREDPTSLLHLVRQMVRVRKQYPVFGWGDFRWVDGAPSAVAAYLRSYLGRHLLILNNLSGEPQAMELEIPVVTNSRPADLLGNFEAPEVRGGRLTLTLEPFQYLWFLL